MNEAATEAAFSITPDVEGEFSWTETTLYFRPRGDSAVLGAVLGGAIGEATRTSVHLALGAWRGILLDAEHALLHLAPAGSDTVMMLAARRDAPAGWMLRASAHAIGQAQQFMEEYA
jgi:predicted regulator of Ras-like GTPase activity (Roadblock/LC7/MglB family)